MNGYEDASRFYRVVERIVTKVLRNLGYVRAPIATVTAVNSNLITAYLAGDDISNTSVYENRTNTTILVNDLVYVIIPNGKSLTSAFIGWVIK